MVFANIFYDQDHQGKKPNNYINHRVTCTRFIFIIICFFISLFVGVYVHIQFTKQHINDLLTDSEMSQTALAHIKTYTIENTDITSRPKRFIHRGFITNQEIDDIKSIFSYYGDAFVTDHPGLKSLSLQSLLLRQRVNFRTNNSNTVPLIHSFMRVRNRVFKAIQLYYNLNTLYNDATTLSIRYPGDTYAFENELFNHGIHVDNCNLVLDSDLSCEYDANTYHRQYSAVLYLQAALDGGELVFFDKKSKNFDEVITTEPSKLIIHTSDYENIHGVKQVKEGERLSITLWFTSQRNSSIDEKVAMGLYGSPYFKYLHLD